MFGEKVMVPVLGYVEREDLVMFHRNFPKGSDGSFRVYEEPAIILDRDTIKDMFVGGHCRLIRDGSVRHFLTFQIREITDEEISRLRELSLCVKNMLRSSRLERFVR